MAREPARHVLAAVFLCQPLENFAEVASVDAGAIEAKGVVVDAASGVSGAGRAASTGTHFCAVNGNFRAYGLLNHRHTAEMQMMTGAEVIFTPHLAPMSRGILATCYARATKPGDPLAILRDAYAPEPFVHVGEAPPETKWATGSNAAFLTARYDERTNMVVAIAAIDNLGKGAAGQMIQCANLMLGFDETAGLPAAGVYPAFIESLAGLAERALNGAAGIVPGDPARICAAAERGCPLRAAAREGRHAA